MPSSAHTIDRNAEAALEAGTAIERVFSVLGVAAPLRFLMLVEDPGAANFAAGLMPALTPHGDVTIYASGMGQSQLSRLGMSAAPLPALFDPEAFLAEIKPGLVLLGTSENMHAASHELVSACRAARIPTLGFIDGPANIQRRFRGSGTDALAFAPDAVLVPAARIGAELRSAGYASERIFVIAHPHFDRLRGEKKRLDSIGRAALRRQLFAHCPADRPVLVFLAECSDGLNEGDFRRNAQYTLTGRGDEDRRTNVVLEEVLDAVATLTTRPYIVLRLHPKNQPSEFASYNGEFDQTSRDEPAIDIVYAADAVIGLTSILLSEAAVLGRPVLAVVPRDCECEWILDPPQHRIRCVSGRVELISALKGLIQ